MTRLLLFLSILMLGSSGAAAIDAKHGGKVAQTSGHHFVELVLKEGGINVHVLHDDGTAQDVAGAKGMAVVLSGGNKEQIPLAPSGAYVLSGSGDFKNAAGTVVVVTLTMSKHSPEQARFVLD